MTDDDRNRLVAVRVLGLDVRWNVRGRWWQIGNDDTSRIPAYCTDPAAWGALLVWLAEQKRNPSIWFENNEGDLTFGAAVGIESNYDNCIQVDSYDTLPGRALVLAALKAWGVEVGDD